MPHEISFMREQFSILGPNKNGFISLQSFKAVTVIFVYRHLVIARYFWFRRSKISAGRGEIFDGRDEGL